MRVRINKPPTLKQKALIRQECQKEFEKLLNVFDRDVALQIAHILHFDYGFGQKRLQQFMCRLKAMQQEQRLRYELSPDDTSWICEKQLRDSKIDIEALLGGDYGEDNN